jgi:imidazole glycerol-phosphate synthase subunit HisH
MIAVIDYGMGNIGSIVNMIKKVGGQSKIVQTADELLTADKAILPGIGAFDTAIETIHNLNLWEAINEFALIKKKPVLGVCLGMQLLCNSSEEGTQKGLGWIDAEVKKFNFENVPNAAKLKIPHMGWNVVTPVNTGFPLFKNADNEMRFYFVHSYAVHCKYSENVMGTSFFGYKFDAVIAKDNIMGFQCHPEKSHRFGMKVYKNFIDL